MGNFCRSVQMLRRSRQRKRVELADFGRDDPPVVNKDAVLKAGALAWSPMPADLDEVRDAATSNVSPAAEALPPAPGRIVQRLRCARFAHMKQRHRAQHGYSFRARPSRQEREQGEAQSWFAPTSYRRRSGLIASAWRLPLQRASAANSLRALALRRRAQSFGGSTFRARSHTLRGFIREPRSVAFPTTRTAARKWRHISCALEIGTPTIRNRRRFAAAFAERKRPWRITVSGQNRAALRRRGSTLRLVD